MTRGHHTDEPFTLLLPRMHAASQQSESPFISSGYSPLCMHTCALGTRHNTHNATRVLGAGSPSVEVLSIFGRARMAEAYYYHSQRTSCTTSNIVYSFTYSPLHSSQSLILSLAWSCDPFRGEARHQIYIHRQPAANSATPTMAGRDKHAPPARSLAFHHIAASTRPLLSFLSPSTTPSPAASPAPTSPSSPEPKVTHRHPRLPFKRKSSGSSHLSVLDLPVQEYDPDTHLPHTIQVGGRTVRPFVTIQNGEYRGPSVPQRKRALDLLPHSSPLTLSPSSRGIPLSHTARYLRTPLSPVHTNPSARIGTTQIGNLHLHYSLTFAHISHDARLTLALQFATI